MERIDLFDRYISGKLSASETDDFKARLEAEPDFASDFKVYLLTVRGICQEADQDNAEFGHAMKSLSRKQLQTIIGKTEQRRVIRPSFFRERMMWISSLAAMLVIAIGIGWNLYSSSQAHLCDVVYGYNYQPLEGNRGDGSKYVNLNDMTSEEIKSELPRLEINFNSTEVDTQDWHIEGMTLAMAYLKLHQKGDAIRVLSQLAANSENPEVYNRMIEQRR